MTTKTATSAAATGTVRMADGTQRDARRDTDGLIRYATFGNINEARGHAWRKATEKQAATFAPDEPEAPQPAVPTTVTRESDGAQFTIGQHVTVKGFPGMHWLITDVYAAGVYGQQPAATVETAPLNGQNARLLALDALAHVDNAEQPQESAYPTPTDAANALARQLVEALDSLSTPPTPDVAVDDVDALVKRIVRRAQYDALKAMRPLPGHWQDATRQNHDALDHRDAFPDCCGMFAVGDVQRMIDDAARELGIPAPPVAS